MPVSPEPIQAPVADLRSRDRILKVAARLFAAKGYHAVGMTELGQAVGLSRGAMYHHIESKQDLLDEICSRYMSELRKQALEVIRIKHAPFPAWRYWESNLCRQSSTTKPN